MWKFWDTVASKEREEKTVLDISIDTTILVVGRYVVELQFYLIILT